MAYLDPEFSSLPEGWSSKLLNDVVEIHNTKRQPLNSREREGRKGIYPYCGANGVVDYIDDYRFDGEYVLIAEDGGYWGKHQPSSYIMRGKFWVNNHAHVVCAIPTETTNAFFSNIVNYLNIDPFIGGDARGKLTKAILTQLAIPLPSLPEQKKIAHILSTVQRAIEAQERIIQTTTELKKALMHKLFTEGLRNEPQKQTEIGPVPESWEVCKIKDHCINSAFGPRFGSELYAPDGNILTLRTTDMEDDGRIDYNTAPIARIDYAKFKKHYLKVGDVVVSRSGTCGIASVFEGYSMPVLPGAFLIRLRMKPSVQPTFLRHYINSPVGRPYVLQLAQGAIQKNISGTRLGNLSIPLPAIEEQREISAAVGTIDKKLEAHRMKLQANQDLFRTLLHDLMTAKTRVHELEISA